MVFGAEIRLCDWGISVELEGGVLGRFGALERPVEQSSPGSVLCRRCPRVGGKEGTRGRTFERHKVHALSMDGC